MLISQQLRQRAFAEGVAIVIIPDVKRLGWQEYRQCAEAGFGPLGSRGHWARPVGSLSPDGECLNPALPGWEICGRCMLSYGGNPPECYKVPEEWDRRLDY